MDLCPQSFSYCFFSISRFSSQEAMLTIWPESEKLQIALAASSADGNNSRTAYSTFPRVKHELATTSELNVVSLNTETLLALINSGSLRDALYLTTKLLTNLGQGIGAPMQQAATQNCPQSLEIWSCRFQLMMALKFHILLLDELLAFGELDAPDLYLQFHPKFGGTKGSMVPFSLRLVHAEAASFSSLPYQSVQRCLRLEANTKAVLEMLMMRQSQQPNAPDIAIWQQRLEAVRTVQARVLFRLKECEKSSIVYQQLLSDQANSAEKQRSILEALLKMAMHIGDAKAVEMYLAQLGNLCGRESVDFSVYSCFKSMFDGDYGTALATLQHLKVQQPQLFTDPKFCNNEAICLLYNGRAMECMQQLYNHTGRVDDPLVHNLNTVSDLVSTNSQAFKQSYLAKQQQQQQQNGGSGIGSSSGAAMGAATAGETTRNDEVLDDGIQALKIV